jgi:hypothetical protein
MDVVAARVRRCTLHRYCAHTTGRRIWRRFGCSVYQTPGIEDSPHPSLELSRLDPYRRFQMYLDTTNDNSVFPARRRRGHWRELTGWQDCLSKYHIVGLLSISGSCMHPGRGFFFATGTCIGARKAAGQYLNNPCGAGTFRRLKVHYASSIFISS